MIKSLYILKLYIHLFYLIHQQFFSIRKLKVLLLLNEISELQINEIQKFYYSENSKYQFFIFETNKNIY